jgi:hypothetical protein
MEGATTAAAAAAALFVINDLRVIISFEFLVKYLF